MLEAKTVSELQLTHCKLDNFFHLKSLNLDDVYLDEQVIQNLTLNRPLIEDFQLYNCHGFKHLKISNLPWLNLFYVESRIMVSRIEIEAPSLQTFPTRIIIHISFRMSIVDFTWKHAKIWKDYLSMIAWQMSCFKI